MSPSSHAEILRRADEQDRWAQRGDARGVYGVEGARLMKTFDPQRDLTVALDDAANYPATAAVVHTAAELTALLADKLPCWRWAAFASVLVQRRSPLQSRLRDDQLGYATPSGEHAGTSAAVGRFVVERVAEMPRMLRYAKGTVELDLVILHMDVADDLLGRISEQLSTIAAE